MCQKWLRFWLVFEIFKTLQMQQSHSSHAVECVCINKKDFQLFVGSCKICQKWRRFCLMFEIFKTLQMQQSHTSHAVECICINKKDFDSFLKPFKCNNHTLVML